MKQFECFGLDTANQCILRDNAPIALPPKPFAVLRYLVENPGRLITHNELLDALWPETYVQPQVLRTYMLELRRVLGDDAGQPRFIQTLPKRGYRFVAQVTERSVADPHPVAVTAPLATRNDTIVGRDAELDLLQSHLRDASRGSRQVVLVAGGAGIGKTALVDAFCRLPGSAASTTARGQCVPGLGASEPNYPVMEALAQLCAGPDGEAACRVLSRLAPAWLAHSPESGGYTPSRERAVADLCAAIEELAARKPLLLVFEDIHWADESTLHLVSALARRRAPAQIVVIATFRPPHGASEDPLKEVRQDLLMRRLCVEIELGPLRRAAVKQLLSRELEQEALPPGLADFIYQRSEGNPLFVIAVLEHLRVQGILVRECAAGTARWVQHEPFAEMEAGVPHALERMIALEIERLGEDEQCLLEAASLMAVAFPAWAVAAALAKDPLEVEEACDALARRIHFLVRAGQDELPNGTTSAFYVFAHGLYREVLNQRQTVARRARRHIRIAERLGQLFAGREADVAREIAAHYEAAGEHHRAALALQCTPVAQA